LTLSRATALAQPILRREEERKLIALWQSRRPPEALERITLAYMRVCFNIASYYTSNPEHLKDLSQEGVFGIHRALDEFDSSYGTRFSTFVRRYIQNAIADKVSATSTDITIPSRVLLDARSGRTTANENPAAHAVIAPSVMFDAPNSDGLPVMEIFPDAAPNPEENAAKSSQEDYFKKLVSSALGELSARERDIVVRRHLTDPPDTLEEIGRDLGVTRERVRQLEAASMAKIGRHVARLSGKAKLFA
jgi:RNA polymerase sigma factor (sigma-70 family)